MLHSIYLRLALPALLLSGAVALAQSVGGTAIGVGGGACGVAAPACGDSRPFPDGRERGVEGPTRAAER